MAAGAGKSAGCRACRRRHELFAGAARALPLLPEAVRTRSALTCGADLVFALPAPCACAGAEAFARAGVALLAAAGCDGLVFGAETPDTALLMEAAELLDSGSYRAALKAQLAGGARSFAAARQAAAAELASDERVAALLDKPNNNLAVEYCRAIRSLAPRMEAYPRHRQGAAPGEAHPSAHGLSASASAPRKLGSEGVADAVGPYVAEASIPLYQVAYAAGPCPVCSAAARCLMALLRSA